MSNVVIFVTENSFETTTLIIVFYIFLKDLDANPFVEYSLVDFPTNCVLSQDLRIKQSSQCHCSSSKFPSI